jgi:N utilization substance protein B
MQKRSLAREYAFKFTYKYLLPDFKEDKNFILGDKNNLDKTLMDFDSSYLEHDNEHPLNTIDGEGKKFARDLIFGTLNSEKVLTELIIKYSSQKNPEKMEKINLALLLLGSFEMRSEIETPEAVIINEYVNMAKKYGPPESQGFIHSVLDKIGKEVR